MKTAFAPLFQPSALQQWITSDYMTITLIKLRVEDTLAEMLAAPDAQNS